MERVSRDRRFEQIVIAHLDAAYNLARWLTREERDAEDLVQEACLRAFKFLEGFRGGSERAWLLAIVRNTYYSRLKKDRPQALNVEFDEENIGEHDIASIEAEEIDSGLQREEANALVRDALDALPEEFREVIVLRELEDLSYRDIAKVAGIPIGTVMSRLSRARRFLQQSVRRMREDS